jgi:hypothetical protein
MTNTSKVRSNAEKMSRQLEIKDMLTAGKVAGADQRIEAKAACPPFPSVQFRI